MRTNFRNMLLAIVASGLVANGLFAQGNVSLDFETDPAEGTGVLFFGDSEWIDPDFSSDGNGYLSVTDAENGQSGRIVFPDLSDPPGTPLTSFSISALLRVGDPNNTNAPADGFSFNLVRADDPLLTDAPLFAGVRGEASLPEEGSRTGLAIGFDEWQSGAAAPNAVNSGPLEGLSCGDTHEDLSNPADTNIYDCVGMSIRVDGVLLGQAAFPTRNGEVGDPRSLQTGPQGEIGNGAGSGDTLVWEKLLITVTPDELNEGFSNLAVSFKGRSVFNENIEYTPSAGQLVFAGRTGDANSNHHIDNIEIITEFAPDPIGDFDIDGDVDFEDFLILANNMNTAPGLGLVGDYEAGDANFSGTVDIADFVIFREVFGAQGVGGAASVPEPSGVLLAFVAGLGLLAGRRRRFG